MEVGARHPGFFGGERGEAAWHDCRVCLPGRRHRGNRQLQREVHRDAGQGGDALWARSCGGYRSAQFQQRRAWRSIGRSRARPRTRSFSIICGAAGVADDVEVHRAYSCEVAAGWDRPIGFLWIDGDHSYRGAKSDFDGFIRHLLPGGVVAFHDALHEFAGPIRVFVEDVLRSDRFGAAGFVQSIAWAQFAPEDGARFRLRRAALERRAAPLIPLLKDERELADCANCDFKLLRSRVPRR